MENEIEEIIDSKYLIKEKKGSGFTSNAFLVTERGNNIKYIAKVLKKDDEETQKFYKNEVKYLTILKEDSNHYVLNIKDSGESKEVKVNYKKDFK